MAVLAARLDLKIQQIRHSGILRAAQTAEIFGSALAPLEGVVSVGGLNPTDEVGPIARLLAMENQTLMLVGHLPSLARLTGELVDGDADSEPIKFRNSCILCLVQQGKGWGIRWFLSPG
jgi:phosphohistidine phosphatase